MKNEHQPFDNPVWIIEKLPIAHQKDHEVFTKYSEGPVTEYRLSDLGRYLINPSKILISDKLVGCSVLEKNKNNGSVRSLFQFKKSVGQNNWIELLSNSHIKNFTFRDTDLENHFNSIYNALRSYDPLIQKLSQLNPGDILDIAGVCEDVSGTRYKLELKGTNEARINYLVDNLLNEVTITMSKAYLSNGLFELRGFDFTAFDPERSHRLIKYFKNNTLRHKVLTAPGHTGFDIDDPTMIQFLHFLQRAIHFNPKLNKAIVQCISGNARPFKLFFTKKIDLSYSNTYVPCIFNSDTQIKAMHASVKTKLAEILNAQQRVVSFNYVPFSETGDDKMHSSISVLHNLIALDPVKNHFPELYNKLNDSLPTSDNGKYYLLDAMQGCDE